MYFSKTFSVFIIIIIGGYFIVPGIINRHSLSKMEAREEQIFLQNQERDQHRSSEIKRWLNTIPISDNNLRKCVHEHLLRNKKWMMNVDSLTYLNCSYMKIKSLSGIDYFTHLASLNVSHNQIDRVNPLLKLKELKNLNLNGNQISDYKILLNIEYLNDLEIFETKTMFCQDVIEFYRQASFRIHPLISVNVQCKGKVSSIDEFKLASIEKRIQQGEKVSQKDEIFYLEWKLNHDKEKLNRRD